MFQNGSKHPDSEPKMCIAEHDVWVYLIHGAIEDLNQMSNRAASNESWSGGPQIAIMIPN